MANKLDPHHLVALMSHVLERNSDGSSRWFDPTSTSPKYGMTNKYKKKIRTVPVLDALAAICVYKKRAQVVAVGFQLDPGERQIRLTIAENQKVEDCVKNHIESVWRNLQTLSNETVAAKWESDKHKEGLTNKPLNVVHMLRIKIFREIYEFSLQKEMRRVERWWGGLVDFSKKLCDRRGEPLEGVERELTYVVVRLDPALQLLRKLHAYPEQGLTDEEWARVYAHSRRALERARLVLAGKNRFSCEALANELNGRSLLTPIMRHM